MHKFLSCDWGTTSFRLRLIDAAKQIVLAETITKQGIAAMYDLWKTQQNSNRILFYSNYINDQIQNLEQQINSSLTGVPLIIAGMASSAIGMKELPYKKIPFIIQPRNLLIDVTEATTLFQHKTILISGACCLTDVMRGEETILAGCAINKNCSKQLFILPGTHSKHILIENEMLIDVKTFMTGEVFQLLVTKSILSNSVESNDAGIEVNSAFIKGVQDAASSSLLNNIFRIRVNTLFDTMNKKENFHYLSGLLIGEELKQVILYDIQAITIVSSGSLLKLYQAAISALNKNFIVSIEEADKALIKAQTILVEHYQ